MAKVSQTHTVLLIAAVLFAANYVVAGNIMPVHIEPSGLALWCVFGTTVLLWIVHRFISREKPDRDDYPRFIQSALPGAAIYHLMFFNGLNLIPAVNAPVVMTITPVLVVVVSAFVLKKTITPAKVLGMVLGTAGALLLVSGAKWQDASLQGVAMVALSALGHGLFLLSVKPLLRKYDALTVVKWVFTFGCVMVFPFGYDQALEIRWAEMPAMALGSVFYVITGGTCLAWFFTAFGMKTMNPAEASAYVYLQPLFVVIIHLAFGADKWHWILIPAALATLTGLYLITRSNGRISEPPTI